MMGFTSFIWKLLNATLKTSRIEGDAFGIRFFEDIRADLTYGIRQLRSAPAFTLAAAVTLAIGIGANTSVFTLENAVMLRPLPVTKPHELRQLEWRSAHPTFVRSYAGFTWHDDQQKASFSLPVFEYIRDHTTAFSGVVAFGGLESVRLRSGDVAAEVQSTGISGNYFQVLGMTPALGRFITPEDSTNNSSAAAVLSYGLWQRAFAGDKSVIGRKVTLDNVPAVIVGVAPQEFFGLRPLLLVTADVFVPFAASRLSTRSPAFFPTRGNFNLLLFARLRPDVTDEIARFETERLMQQAIESDPPTTAYDPPKVALTYAARGMDSVRHSFGPFLALTMAVAGIVLLVACANLAGLLLSRAHGRQREVATRLALGASRTRLIRQHLTESFLLSGLGTVLGLPAASVFVAWLPSLIPDDAFRPGFDLSLDYRVFFFSVLLCIFCSVLFGLAPALHFTRFDILTLIKASPAQMLRNTRFVSGRILVSLQLGLSLLLLTGAGLCLRTLHNIHSAPLGFDPERILTFSIDPSASGYKGPRLTALLEEIAQRVRSVPSVRSVSFSTFAPLSGTRSTTKVCLPDETLVQAHTLEVSPQFFETMRIRLTAGRDFDERDRQGSTEAAIVNETFAKRFLKDGQTIGRNLRLMPPIDRASCSDTGQTVNVIGIAADTKYDNLRDDAPATIYTDYLRHDKTGAAFEVAASVDPLSLVKTIRQLIEGIDPGLTMLEVRPESNYINLFMTPERLLSMMITSVACIALFLSCVGLYGTVAYTVSRRIPEIGLRMALGARRSQVVGMIVGECGASVLIGLVLGLVSSLTLTRFLAVMLYGVKPIDAISITGATILLVAAAVSAAAIPARRASRIDPMVALRHE